jgi:universal stress protein A
MNKLSRLLVPVDYSEQSRRALEYAGQLAEAFKATVDIVHCFDRPSYVSDDVFIERQGKRRPLVEVLREDAEREMAQFLSGTKLPHGVTVDSHLIGGDPAGAVCERLRDGGYDVVVIGTSGKSGVRQLLLGSVAARLVRLSPVPVLTIPPAGEGA